jgi:hypothetical protein
MDELPRRYIETWAAGNREGLGALVADDVDFAGPMAVAQGRDDFLDTVLPFAEQLAGHVAGDDEDAVVIYAMDTKAFGTIPAAEHVRFAEGRLTWSRLIFDSWPVRRAAGQTGRGAGG